MKKKTIALALVLVMAFGVTVGGTLAYLTSTTDVVTNTFTVGKVEITLDETDVDIYGEKDGDNPVTENTYKLIPGHSYIKDPTIHVDKDSEACWLFVKVVDEIAAIQDDDKVAAQMADIGWTAVAENVYAYKEVVSAGTNVKVFESFKIKGDAVVADYLGKTITVTGYAVQADGFGSAAAAWTATFGKPAEPTPAE